MRPSLLLILASLAVPGAARAGDPTGLAFAQSLASKIEARNHLAGVFGKPTLAGCHYLRYSFEKEQVLKPGEAAYFAVPEAIQKDPLTYMVIGHRQDPKTQRGYAGKLYGRDAFPGLTLVGVWDEARSDWRTPKGEWSSKGKLPAKFAEVKQHPEKDAIFDVGRLGHVSAEDGKGLDEQSLLPKALRLVSVGSDPVYLSEIAIRTFPGGSNDDDVRIFTPHTHFDADSLCMGGDRYGGGDRYSGRYPNALSLFPGHPSRGPRPADWKDEPGQVAIPLKVGSVFREVIAKIGDSHPDGMPNDDGHIGSHGDAKFTIAIRAADGAETILMDKENVGPQGTFRASPLACDYVVKAGDELLLRSDRYDQDDKGDVVYLMGVKIRYLTKP